MEDIFASLDIVEESLESETNEPFQLPQYTAKVESPGWFNGLAGGTTKRDAVPLLHALHSKMYLARTKEDHAECLNFALDVRNKLYGPGRPAISVSDARSFDENIVRCAINAGDLDFASKFAAERFPEAPTDVGTLHLLFTLACKAGLLRRAVGLFKQMKATSNDYWNLLYLSDAFLLANSGSLIAACLLERAVEILRLSIRGRRQRGLDNADEDFRKAQDSHESAKMEQKLNGLREKLDASGIAEGNLQGPASAAVQNILDGAEAAGPTAELANLEKEDLEFLAVLLRSANLVKEEVEEKSALEL